MTGLFRTGWQMDYPSIENFLVPLYKTGASSNDGGYSNPKFDALMDEGAALPGDQGIAKFQEGETILAQDMPVIPCGTARSWPATRTRSATCSSPRSPGWTPPPSRAELTFAPSRRRPSPFWAGRRRFSSCPSQIPFHSSIRPATSQSPGYCDA